MRTPEELKQQERHYDSGRLAVVFAWSAIALTAVTLWSILDDYSRGWKAVQRRFAALEVARLQQEIEAGRQKVDPKRQAELQEKLAAAEAAVGQAAERLAAIDGEVAGMSNDLYVADQNVRFTKALLDTARYEFEEARRHGQSDEEDRRAHMEELQSRLREYDDALKVMRGKEEALKAERRKITADRDDATAGLAALQRDISRLERSLERLDKPVTNALLNAPVVDFVAPTEKIQQVVLEGLMNDINFMRVPRVDRCQTCHLGAGRAEYAGAEKPFTAHPKLALIGPSAAPHPFEKIGCTTCHAGRDRATGFTEAAHMPDSEEEAARWEEENHWHRMHHWDFPMYPKRYAEAGCLQCHMQEVHLPGADKLSRGRELFETLGCHGCHKVAGWEDLRKVGPSLKAVGVKTDRDWVRHWLANPRAYNPTTKMPQFWFQSNSADPDSRLRNTVEIDAVVEYLFSHTETGRFPAPPAGDPERGRALIENVGCHGCHSAIGPAAEHADADARSHGPNIMRIGVKTNPGWIYQWVRNPRNLWRETWMPDLRLTTAEAADVATYLASLRDDSWRAGAAELLATDTGRMTALRDEMVLELLARKAPRADAESRLAAMSERDRQLMLGAQAISHYGCHGCHEIAGFETAQRIGTELTREGSKYVDQFDFGFVDLPRERHAWLFQKLKDPRIFDDGKVKRPDEKLKMPNFHLSDEEADALVTLLLGLKVDEVAPELRNQLDAREVAEQKGWRLARNYNCTGCHLVEGRGGDIRPWIVKIKARDGIGKDEALAFSPPNLQTEGAKVQSEWLFRFLKNVEPIRPWLQVRMPSFPFTDVEANTVTQFFAALETSPFPHVDYRHGFRLPAGRAAEAAKLASKEYLNCLSCHQYGSQRPTAPRDSWAPDLAMARTRLRHDWIQRWLADPQKISPGTRMPSFFLDENSGAPDILDGDEREQMRLMADWVMSLGEARPYPSPPLYQSPPPPERQAVGGGSGPRAGSR